MQFALAKVLYNTSHQSTPPSPIIISNASIPSRHVIPLRPDLAPDCYSLAPTMDWHTHFHTFVCFSIRNTTCYLCTPHPSFLTPSHFCLQRHLNSLRPLFRPIRFTRQLIVCLLFPVGFGISLWSHYAKHYKHKHT